MNAGKKRTWCVILNRLVIYNIILQYVITMFFGIYTYSALVIYNSSTDIRPKETIDISTCHIHVIDGEVCRHRYTTIY
jgi:hypothetical protein